MLSLHRQKPDAFAPELINRYRSALNGQIIRTPTLPLVGSKIAPLLPEGAEAYLKCELFQHTGSFKARGAWLGMAWLNEEERSHGVATFSGGNHALAISWAAQQFGISAKVIMPRAADPLRIAGCRQMGAEVILTEDIAAAAALLQEIGTTENRTILHPFNDINMAYGAASCGAEFIEDTPVLDYVVLPVGGGGLIAGMAAAIKHKCPDTIIIGVEPCGANSLSRSFASQKPEALSEVKTIADSLGAPAALAESFSLARRYVDEVIEIDDMVMSEMMVEMRDRLNLFVEPACAASLGAASGPLRKKLAGKQIGVMACGANISAARFDRYTAGQTGSVTQG